MNRSDKANYDPRLHIVLYEPQIPFNTGSVGRTCVAAGAKLWLVRPLGFRVDDKHLRRAGLDYWQHLTWEVADCWEDLVERLGQQRMWFFSKKARRSYLTADFESGDVLVFGSETQGLPEPMLNTHPESCLRIPIRPEARSLNLSNSVAIATFEACRRWDAPDNDAPSNEKAADSA